MIKSGKCTPTHVVHRQRRGDKTHSTADQSQLRTVCCNMTGPLMFAEVTSDNGRPIPTETSQKTEVNQK